MHLQRSFIPAGLARGIKYSHRRCKTTSISELQAAFRDPSSPYHIPPGTQGPESPNSPSHSHGLDDAALRSSDPLTKGFEQLEAQGFDPKSFWEQKIVWGDHDAMQHVNNVRYARFFESTRIRWMASFGHELGGPEKAEAMLKGQGVSVILKAIEVRFRRPVTYPDSLLIGYKPVLPSQETKDNATFEITASAFSVAQQAFVAHSKETLVWYDYDNLKKSDPGERIRELIFGRLKRV